jgi:5-methylcytosine-specific restriction endonuclease McrA
VQLIVHHIDGNAAGASAHRLSNLEVVCRRCHIAHHRPELSPAALEARVWPPVRG